MMVGVKFPRAAFNAAVGLLFKVEMDAARGDDRIAR